MFYVSLAGALTLAFMWGFSVGVQTGKKSKGMTNYQEWRAMTDREESLWHAGYLSYPENRVRETGHGVEILVTICGNCGFEVTKRGCDCA